MIATWTIAPYTHNANPTESEMRRVMEGAVQLLHDSGFPPSFLLQALQCFVHSKNRVYTSVCNTPAHKYQTPYERFTGKKPSIHDIARFGSKPIRSSLTSVFPHLVSEQQHTAHGRL